MSTAIAVVLVLHGIAHLVGFAVPWRLTKGSQQAYKTTIIGGRDVGPMGIRFIGIFYLALAVAFVAMAYGAFADASWWPQYTLFISGLSLFLCIVNWPDTKIGLVLNIIIIAYLVITGGK